jgi:aminopeptidase N
MLARFRDPALVERTLDYAVSGEVRNQDSSGVLVTLLRDRETQDQAWNYIQKNWEKVRAQLTVSSGEDLVRATGYFCSVERREEVTSFFAAHKVEASDRTLAKAVDSMNACLQLRAAQGNDLHKWLAARAQ